MNCHSLPNQQFRGKTSKDPYSFNPCAWQYIIRVIKINFLFDFSYENGGCKRTLVQHRLHQDQGGLGQAVSHLRVRLLPEVSESDFGRQLPRLPRRRLRPRPLRSLLPIGLQVVPGSPVRYQDDDKNRQEERGTCFTVNFTISAYRS